MALAKRLIGTGRRLAVVVMLVLVSSSLAMGCDRTEISDKEGGEETNQESSDDGDYGGDEADSIYPELVDVEPVEPTDFGPEAPAIYILSGLKGYTEPCGCTADVLLGGIDRITAFVHDAAGLHSQAAVIDAGDWVFEYDEIAEHLRPQEEAKAEVLAQAHRQMGTLFSVPGDRDLARGVEFYLSIMDDAGMAPIGANIKLGDMRPEPSKRIELGDEQILFVGAVDPQHYVDIAGVEVSDEVEAITEAVESDAAENAENAENADVVVLVYQGGPARAAELVETLEGVDFAIVGHNPQRKEDTTKVGAVHLVEAYDQGRYVGRLKFYGTDHAGPFQDARAGVRAQRETLDAEIDRVSADLRRLNLRAGGEETPMAERLEERIADLEERRQRLLREGIEVADDSPSFLYDLIAMEPGYRLDESMRESREAYNRMLGELNADLGREPLPVDDGEPFFVGQGECASCHGEAHDFWEQTAHASAVHTLEVRHKQYDQNCIGCHVDGWEKPGGSVLGNIEYEAELNGRTFSKDLHEVGCESCHGAGSNHLVRPLDDQGEPQHIIRKPTAQECMQCHVPDHSPTFDFDVYVEQITGDGHEYVGAQ